MRAMSTWLEKIVGAPASETVKSPPLAHASGAEWRLTRTETVAVNIITLRATTTVTLARISLKVPPP
jgi:hypothetical protein